jgi:membrane protein
MMGRMAALAPTLERFARWLPEPLRGLVHIGERTLGRFVELEGFDRAMALAGQAFAALLPLLIVIGAVSPGGGRDLAEVLTERFKLSGSSATALDAAVARPAEVQSAISVLGMVLLIVTALSFTRALQRLYVRAWRLDKLGLRGTAWGLEWLACFAAFWSAQPVVVGVFDGVVAFSVALGLSSLLWLMTPWILIGRQIPVRRLMPQAFLTAIGVAGVGVWAALYAPGAVSSAASQFGVIGVAFSLLSLLFVAALVLVVAAAIGATLAEPRKVEGTNGLGRPEP